MENNQEIPLPKGYTQVSIEESIPLPKGYTEVLGETAPDVKKKEQTKPVQEAPLPGLGGVSEEPTPSPSVGQGFSGYKVDPSRYETKLSQEDEVKFQDWLKKQHNIGNITDGDYRHYKEKGYGYNYDFRAAFKENMSSAINEVDDKPHWGDIGKKPNHPTFSNESKYHNVDGYVGGSWEGENYTPPEKLQTTRGVLRDVDQTQPTGEEFITGVSDLTRTDVREPQQDGVTGPTGPTGATGTDGQFDIIPDIDYGAMGIGETPTGAPISMDDPYTRKQDELRRQASENKYQFGIDEPDEFLPNYTAVGLPENVKDSDVKDYLSDQIGEVQRRVNQIMSNPQEYGFPQRILSATEEDIQELTNQIYKQSAPASTYNRGRGGLVPLPIESQSENFINLDESYFRNVVKNAVNNYRSRYEVEKNERILTEITSDYLKAGYEKEKIRGVIFGELSNQEKFDDEEKKLYDINNQLRTLRGQLSSLTPDSPKYSEVQQKYNGLILSADDARKKLGDDREALYDTRTGERVDKIDSPNTSDLTLQIQDEMEQLTFEEDVQDVYIKAGLADNEHKSYGQNTKFDIEIPLTRTGKTDMLMHRQAIDGLKMLGYESSPVLDKDGNQTNRMSFKDVSLSDISNSYVREAVRRTNESLAENAERWHDRNVDLMVKRIAARNMSLLNIDPGKIKKEQFSALGIDFYPTRMLEVIGEEVLPKGMTEEIGISDVKLVDNAIPQLEAHGIELTESQKENAKRGIDLEVQEGVASFVPVIAELAFLNKGAGALKAATGLGKIVETLRAGSKLERGTAIAIEALIEEGQMQIAGMNTGAGASFSVMGNRLRKYGLDKFPLRFKGELARLNKLGDNVWSNSMTGVVTMEFASNVEAAIEDFMGGETMQNHIEQNYSDLSEVGKRGLVNALVFNVIGAGGLIGKGQGGFRIRKMEEARDEMRSKGYTQEADRLDSYIKEYYAGKKTSWEVQLTPKEKSAIRNRMARAGETGDVEIQEWFSKNPEEGKKVLKKGVVSVGTFDKIKSLFGIRPEIIRDLSESKVEKVGENYEVKLLTDGKEVASYKAESKEEAEAVSNEINTDLKEKESVVETATTVTEPTGDIVPAKQKGRLTKFSTPQDGIVGEVTYEDGTKKELTQEEYDALEKQEGLFDVETGTQPVAKTVPTEAVVEEAAPTETPSEMAAEKVEEVPGQEVVKPTESVAEEVTVKKKDEVQTGKSLKIRYNKNPQKAPDMGAEFGQDVEASGDYVTQKVSDFTPEGFETGVVELENPLVIDITDDTQISYKNELSQRYDGKVGEELSEAIRQDGYDAIVTKYDDGSTGEIVLLKGQRDAIQEQAAGKVPVQPEAKAGEKVEEGKPQAEPEVAAEKGKAEVLSEEDAKSEKKVKEKIEEDSGKKDLVKEVIKSTVTEEEKKKVAEEEGIDDSEVESKIEEEVINQINDKTEKEPKTLLQRIASRIRKAIMSLLIVANALNISGVKAPTAKTKAYDNIKVENLQSFDKMYMDQEAVNKKNNIDIIRKSQANKGENYIVIDKSTGSAHLFKGEDLITSYQVGVGEKSGDIQTRIKSIYLNDKTGKEVPISVATTEKNGVKYLKPGFSSRTNWNEGTKTTGAGIFKIAEKTSYIGKDAFALLNEQGISTEMMLHEVTNTVRAKLMSDGNPDNNRITNGCVNFMYQDTKDLGKRGVGAGTMVYVLPDNPNNVFKLVDGELRFESENTNVNRTTAYTKPFQSQPITIKSKKQIPQTAKEFLVTIADVKSEIMDAYPTISNDEYNRMAKIAYGIFGQESSFGTYGGPRGKAGFIKDLSQIALKEIGIDQINVFGKILPTSDPSVGLTQTRLSSIPEKIRERFGINESKDLLNNEKSAIATMAAMVNMYVNEIEPTKMGNEMENIIPLGWSNDRKSDSPFVKALKGDKSQYKNKYVENVNNSANDLDVYIGETPIEKKSDKEAPTDGETPIGLMALPLLFGGTTRRRKPLEDADSDKVVTDWMEDVQRIYDAQKTKNKQEAVNEAATNLALSGRLNELAPDQRLKVLEDIANQTTAMDKKTPVSVAAEVQGLTLKEQFKQGFEEYLSAMKQKEADRKEKAKESAQKKIDAEKEKVRKLKEKAKEEKEEAKQGFEEYLDARKRKEAERIQKIETKLQERIDKLKEKAKEAVQNAKDDVAARKIFNEIMKAEMKELGLGTLTEPEIKNLLSMAKQADRKKIEDLIERGINLMAKAAKRNLKTEAESSRRKLGDRIKKGDFGATPTSAIAIANIPIENIPVERLPKYTELLSELASNKGKVSAIKLNEMNEFVKSIADEIENKITGVDFLAEMYELFRDERSSQEESQDYIDAKSKKKNDRTSNEQSIIDRVDGDLKEQFGIYLEEIGLKESQVDFAKREFESIQKQYRNNNTEKGKPLTASEKIDRIKQKRQEAIDDLNSLHPIEKGGRGIDVSMYGHNEVYAETAAFFNKLGNNQLKDLSPSEIRIITSAYDNMKNGLMLSPVFALKSKIEASMINDQMAQSSSQFSRMLATTPKDLPANVKKMAEDFTLPFANLYRFEEPTSVTIKSSEELGKRMLAEQTPYIKYLLNGIKGDPVYEMLNRMTGAMTIASKINHDVRRKTYDLFYNMKGLPLENNQMLATFGAIREYDALDGVPSKIIKEPIVYLDSKINNARKNNQGVYESLISIKEKYFNEDGTPKRDKPSGMSLIEIELIKRGGKGLIDFMDKSGDISREMGRVNAQRRGLLFEEIDGYMSTRAEQKNNLDDKLSKLNGGRISSSVNSDVIRSRTGQTERTFDAVGDFINSFTGITNEYYLSEPVSVISNFVTIANKTGNVNLARFANAIKDYVSGSLESQFNANYYDENNLLLDSLRQLTQTVKSGAVFGVFAKPISEVTSQGLKIVMNPETLKAASVGVGILMKAGNGVLNFDKAYDFMEAIKSTHLQRAGTFNSEIHQLPSYWERKMGTEAGRKFQVYNKLRPIVKPLRTGKRKAERASELSQIAPDAFGIIQVQIGAFFEKFKEITGNYPDFNKIIGDNVYRAENADAIRKARAYADQLTSKTAAPGSMAETAKRGYVVPTLRAFGFKKMPGGIMDNLVLFETYPTSERRTILINLKQMRDALLKPMITKGQAKSWTGDAENAAKIAAELGGRTTAALSYQIARMVLFSIVNMGISIIEKSLFGTDEDEIEYADELQNGAVKGSLDLASNLALGAAPFPVKLASYAFIYGGLRVYEESTDKKDEETLVSEEFRKSMYLPKAQRYQDVPSFVSKFGVQGKAAADAVELGFLIEDIANGGDPLDPKIAGRITYLMARNTVPTPQEASRGMRILRTMEKVENLNYLMYGNKASYLSNGKTRSIYRLYEDLEFDKSVLPPVIRDKETVTDEDGNRIKYEIDKDKLDGLYNERGSIISDMMTDDWMATFRGASPKDKKELLKSLYDLVNNSKDYQQMKDAYFIQRGTRVK